MIVPTSGSGLETVLAGSEKGALQHAQVEGTPLAGGDSDTTFLEADLRACS